MPVALTGDGRIGIRSVGSGQSQGQRDGTDIPSPMGLASTDELALTDREIFVRVAWATHWYRNLHEAIAPSACIPAATTIGCPTTALFGTAARRFVGRRDSPGITRPHRLALDSVVSSVISCLLMRFADCSIRGFGVHGTLGIACGS